MPATSAKARKPIFCRAAMIFKPCATKARLTPVSATTSHTVPSATMSSNPIKSGALRSAYQPASRSLPFTATHTKKATPTAAN